ncbi:MAG: SDR family oxidoreductase, partial [Chloroflexi bacterium]|nr:SDR family oxidoreductase [Chloroflexota bacterium]
GSMINISSIMGHIVTARQSGYSSAKGAVSQLTKVLAVEWAPYNVRVNAICPGFTRTPLIQPLVDTEGWEAGIIARTPMGRLAEPREMVGPAVFLASEAASFVTGETLFVDGGYMAL